MKITIAKVTAIFAVLGRVNFGRMQANQTNARDGVCGGGMFGLLVSGDAAQGYLR